MDWTVSETARLAGVSVRTLHYYDEIGLLRPRQTTSSGYRLYGAAELERLQQILFFRELGFPLKEIQNIMSDPAFDREKALEGHRRLLALKRERLDRLIRLVDDTLKGGTPVSFQEFDTSEIEEAQSRYAEEARTRWGNTQAFEESKKRTDSYTKEDWARLQKEMDDLYLAFAAQMAAGVSPGDPEVQKLVRGWQDYITQNYYRCTDEILAGLGQMYTADERFTKNIDRYASGLAVFISRAIAACCG